MENINRIPNWIKQNKIIILVILCALLGNYISFQKIGFRIGNDATRFLSGAESLLNSETLEVREFNYIGYILLVSVNKIFDWNASGIYFFQISFHVLACVLLFLIGRNISSYKTGLIVSLGWGFLIFHTYWNFYIMSDSLFISLLIMIIFLFQRLKYKRSIDILCFLTAVIYLGIFRPNGFYLAVIFLLGSLFIIQSWLLRFGIITCIMLFMGISPTSPTGIVFWSGESQGSFIKDLIWGQLIDGTIIWKKVLIDMPHPENQSPNNIISGYAKYVLNFPIETIGLYLQRIFHFLFNWNPYYSMMRNVVNFCFLAGFHSIFLIGLLYAKKKDPFFCTIAIAILFHLCFVALTHVDYDGRFLAYILPLQVVFVMKGLQSIAHFASKFEPSVTAWLDRTKTKQPRLP
ncbi:MAG: hypothetical protein ACOH5I_06185 [Oligoflexus sp.]